MSTVTHATSPQPEPATAPIIHEAAVVGACERHRDDQLVNHTEQSDDDDGEVVYTTTWGVDEVDDDVQPINSLADGHQTPGMAAASYWLASEARALNEDLVSEPKHYGPGDMP